MKTRLEKSLEISRLAHINDTRWGGESYFEGHVLPVVEIVENKATGLKVLFGVKEKEIESFKIVAALHDVIEDHGDKFPIEKLERELSLTAEEKSALLAVTKQEGENYAIFTLRIAAANLIAKIVKLSDLQHNMSDLKEGSCKDKYRLAEYIIQKNLFPEK